MADTTTPRFKSVCVFCGSSAGNRDCYGNAAVELGQELVARKVDLVYGGGSVGIMGLVSGAVHSGGGRVVGIIPRSLMAREITGETFGEVKEVASMHQRKVEMARCADAFVALPGGYGTLEELFKVIAWAQLGIHRKPVGLLNVDGYFDPLLAFLDKAVGVHSAATAPDPRLRLRRAGPPPGAGGVRAGGGRGVEQTCG